MKKFCALLVLVAFAASSVFAAPSGAAAQIAAAADQVTAVTEAAPATGSGDVVTTTVATVVEDDLFADVEAVELSAEEAEAVEGEGPVSMVAGAAAGWIIGMASGIIGVAADVAINHQAPNP